MNSSMRYWRARSPHAAAVSGSARMARSLPCAATNDCTLSARMTPRDAESRNGLRTPGNVMAFAVVAGSSSRLRNMKRGTGTSALASNSGCRYLSLAGIAEGPVHAELRYNEHGPWLIELAARPIGGRCSAVLRFGDRGVTLEEIILRHGLGMPIPSLQ